MDARSARSSFSQVGRKLTAQTGILGLMDDLGRAQLGDPRVRLLGGGNPALIPEFQTKVRQRMHELLVHPAGFDRLLGTYEVPQGHPRFREALASCLRRAFGWDVGPDHIAVTPGGQCAFFHLFNLLAGRFGPKRHRKVLLPLTPEYIGYADQGLESGLFVACRPEVFWPEGPDTRVFKYRIDFEAVETALRRETVGAVAVSRPTNPSGNVLSDDEVRHLARLTEREGIPLIIDGAYGLPFPGITYVPAQPYWAPHVILVLSLSKLGLPGTRTGIVIAPEPIARAVGSLTAVMGLANAGLGQQLVLPWIESGEILELGPRLLRPFYQEKERLARQWMRESMDAAGVDWAVHAVEGAFFHWLWLRGLRITTRELYERLKAHRVLTVPGEYFFFGLRREWPHRHECLRLSFSQPAEVVREGLEIIAREAARASLKRIRATRNVPDRAAQG